MSDQLAYDLGAYVHELQAQRESIGRLLADNNPWPTGLSPKPPYYEGQRNLLQDVIWKLESLVQRPA